MKLFKLTIAVIGLLACVWLSPETSAQSYSYDALSYTGIGTTAGGATTTVTNQIIDCEKVRNVALIAKFNFSDATTSNVVFTFARSVDRTTWETTPTTTWTIAGNGTTDVIAANNIDMAGYGYLKLLSIQNTHASLVLTNKAMQFSVKKNVP